MRNPFDELEKLISGLPDTLPESRDSKMVDDVAGLSPKEAREMFDAYGNPVAKFEQAEEISPYAGSLQDRATERRGKSK